MTIEAKIIADSTGSNNNRITTFQLKYPRYIHSEMLTHRVFSRNASSSRAIPAKKIREKILKEMVIPISFGKNKKGMQATEEVTHLKQKASLLVWRTAGIIAVFFSYLLDKIGVHKQITNRLTEPFSTISVVVTATEWNNFFALRYHSMAQPEICELARQMWVLYKTSIPKQKLIGQWHLPYVSDEEVKEYFATIGDGVVGSFNIAHWMPLIKRSVARCARVSYLLHDGQKTNDDKDYALYDRLVGSQPIHASCAEHQATPALPPPWSQDEEDFFGNFTGWNQFRKMLPHENITEFKEPLG